MIEVYACTPRVWLLLVVAVFMATLGQFSWRRRSVPGAQPYFIPGDEESALLGTVLRTPCP
jgi:hypothetical protein